jgi:hypothetical protein
VDDFEKEYFQKLTQLASEYKDRRRDLAKSRIKMFVAALYRQLVEEKEKFDLVLAAGNSGLYMSVIAKMVYESLGIEAPTFITIPIYRFKDIEGKIALNDNSSLSSLVKGKLDSLPEAAKILFIDDEVMQGLTVKASLELILEERPDLTSIRCLVIAEHHFFEWHHNMTKVSINFFAYSRLIQGLNGNISYFIPEELFSKISAQINDVESYPHAMAIVIGGALKRKDESGVPFYDTSVATFTDESLMNELAKLVQEGIEDYKNKKIQFRF